MDNNNITKEYSNGNITVRWDASKCAHSGKCVRGLPKVFDVNSKPWVNLEGANDAAIVQQVRSCPSGALSVVRTAN